LIDFLLSFFGSSFTGESFFLSLLRRPSKAPAGSFFFFCYIEVALIGAVSWIPCSLSSLLLICSMLSVYFLSISSIFERMLWRYFIIGSPVTYSGENYACCVSYLYNKLVLESCSRGVEEGLSGVWDRN